MSGNCAGASGETEEAIACSLSWPEPAKGSKRYSQSDRWLHAVTTDGGMNNGARLTGIAAVARSAMTQPGAGQFLFCSAGLSRRSTLALWRSLVMKSVCDLRAK